MNYHQASSAVGRPTRLALAYKLFGPKVGLSHVGLAIANINTSKVLRANGIQSNVVGITSAADLSNFLANNPQDHVHISAPWVPTLDLSDLAQRYPETTFAVVSHSNCAFLQADRNALRLIRECIDLEQTTHNVHIAGNCERFCEWVKGAFNVPCTFLPNLYYLDEHAGGYTHHQPVGSSGPLRVGIFGATRAQKNMMTGVAGAIELARSLRLPLELWLSGGRTEGGGDPILAAIQQMVAGLPGVTLRLNGWQSWSGFRQVVGTMRLLIQMSTSESFNMVTADGISQGVPSVTSEAITWVPDRWKASVDSADDVARVGRYLLHDPHAAMEGLKALRHYVAQGVRAYQHYFGTMI